MKVLIYSDVHFSQDSSIVRSNGEVYSTRLEYLIKSLNWAEKLAVDLGCGYVFNLGDTFDKPQLNAMEITAFKEVKWNSLDHYVLVGNHDSNVKNLKYSSSEVFSSLNNFKVISTPTNIKLNNTSICLLPYITEDKRQSLKDYMKKGERNIILSHNDLKDFQMGKFKSIEGFSIDEIDKECDLFLNGHLHNSSWVSKKILNVGNLCGQNFSEDAFNYKHGAWLLDTDTLEITFYENPYALNFYKLDIDKESDLKKFDKLSKNSVLMIKCEKGLVDKVKEKLNENIVASKIVVYNNEIKDEVNIELNKVDYLQSFKDFIIQELGNSDIVKEELEVICK